MILKIKNNRVLSNISWILAGRIFYMALNFIVGLLSARYLGPSSYGLIGYAAAYTTFFTSICSLGIDSIIVKELIDNKKKEGTILGTSITLKLISSTLSLLTIIGISFIVDHGEPITRMVVFLYSMSLLFQTFETIKYWFQSKLQSKYSELTVTVGYVIMSIYKVFLLLTGKNVKWFALSNTIEYISVAIILYLLYKRKGGDKLAFSWSDGKRILSKSYHFIISGLMVAVYNSTDRFMLKQMLSESEVAYYTTAVTLSGLCTFLLGAIIQSVTPVIMEEFKKSKDVYMKRNKQLYAVIFYISVFFSIFIFIFSKLIINILFGKNYYASISPLRVLTWYTAFSYLGVARNPWIVCENKQKYLKYIYVSCALFNVLLNYLMIPVWNATGAAVASLLTQIATILIFPLFIKELRPNVKLMVDAMLLKDVK